MNQPTPAPTPTTSENPNTPERSSKRSAPAFVPLMAAGLFMITGLCGLLFIGREKARIIGQSVSELDIQPLLYADKPILREDMLGKTTVLHFWGAWCPPCVEEYPDFIAIQEQYQNDPSVIIASIACGNQADDTKEKLEFYTKQFLNKLNAPDFPIFYDPVEFTRSEISKMMTTGGFSYPTTLVINSEGLVANVWRDKVTEKALGQAIEQAKKSAPKS